MMRLDLATDDYIGARSQQQDAAAARGFGTGGGAVLILADGLGGHTGGAEASRIVVDTFREAADAGAFDEELNRRNALKQALDKANVRIASGVDPADGQRGMASTAVAAVIANGAVHWISVGDSHLYLWRAGALTKLNEDHSQAGLMLRSGHFKPTDPEVLAAKSVLVSALTGRRLEIVDHPKNAHALEPGDVVVLASDGLNTLSEEEISDLLSTAQAQDARHISALLLDTVRERRAERQDNTAVVVARVVDVPRPQDAEPSTEIAFRPLEETVASPAVRTVATEQVATPAASPPLEAPDASAAAAPVENKKSPPPAAKEPAPAAGRAAETGPEPASQTPAPERRTPPAAEASPRVASSSPAVAAAGAREPAPAPAQPRPAPVSISSAKTEKVEPRELRPRSRRVITGKPPIGLASTLAISLAIAVAAVAIVLTWRTETSNETERGGNATPAVRVPAEQGTSPPPSKDAVPARQGETSPRPSPNGIRPPPGVEPTRTPGAAPETAPAAPGSEQPLVPPAPQPAARGNRG